MAAHVYKHCVVGGGLTGTAACRHLAGLGEDVVLVGPAEGSEQAHGACYDEGRIYRILDPKECWARLAWRSIGRYAPLAAEAGVEFYSEVGLLIFGVRDAFVRETQHVASRMGTRLEQLDPEELRARFPWLRPTPETQLGLMQTKQAGTLSPRKLCQAQLRVATAQGASHIEAAVESVSKGEGGGPLSVVLADGSVVRAENVLVAAGVYSSLLPLLPEAVLVSLTGAQALLAEVSAETAAQLADMPSMIYESEREEECVYILPPIRYPDGSWLLKVGPSTAFNPPLRTRAEVDAWFRRGRLDEAFVDVALGLLRALLPTVEVLGWRPLLCVTDCTPTENPYVDLLAPGWGVCTGGNGWAAKSSDEIGLLAAQMMALPSHWGGGPELPREWFRAVTPEALRPGPELATALASVEACGNLMLDRALDSLEVLTTLLAASSPQLRRRPDRLALEMTARLQARWGTAPSVLCAPPGSTWVPNHPYVALRAGLLTVLVLPLNSP